MLFPSGTQSDIARNMSIYWTQWENSQLTVNILPSNCDCPLSLSILHNSMSTQPAEAGSLPSPPNLLTSHSPLHQIQSATKPCLFTSRSSQCSDSSAYPWCLRPAHHTDLQLYSWCSRQSLSVLASWPTLSQSFSPSSSLKKPARYSSFLTLKVLHDHR